MSKADDVENVIVQKALGELRQEASSEAALEEENRRLTEGLFIQRYSPRIGGDAVALFLDHARTLNSKQLETLRIAMDGLPNYLGLFSPHPRMSQTNRH